MRLFLILLPLLFITGCSSFKSSEPSDKVSESNSTLPTEFELYLSRSSFSGSEFEQYKYWDGKLFNECGDLRRERHQAKEQQITGLTPQARLQLESALLKLEQSAQYKQPAKNASFSEPGQISLTMRWSDLSKTKISTSLDSISEPSTEPERKLNALVKTVRSLAKQKCGNKMFYGLQG